MEALEPGTLLQLGEQAVLEIVTPRQSCSRLDLIQGKKIELGAVGMMARVLQEGEIKVGDPVRVLQEV